MNKKELIDKKTIDIKERQFNIEFNQAKFLVCNLGYGGYGGQFSLRILAFQLAIYFNRILIFNYDNYIYNECYEPISNFSYDDVKDLKFIKLNFDKRQKDKVVYFDFDSYWSNEKLKKIYQDWIPDSFVKHNLNYRYFSGLLSSFFILKEEYKEKIDNIKKDIGFKKPIIGMHVRRGDKIVESSHVKLSTYVDELVKVREKTGINRVFITSDSPKTIEEMPKKLGFEYVYDHKEKRYNNAMHRFLKQHPELVKQETITASKILELLGSSNYVIGQKNTHFTFFGSCISMFRTNNEDNATFINVKKHKKKKEKLITFLYSYYDKARILVNKFILNKLK